MKAAKRSLKQLRKEEEHKQKMETEHSVKKANYSKARQLVLQKKKEDGRILIQLGEMNSE